MCADNIEYRPSTCIGMGWIVRVGPVHISMILAESHIPPKIFRKFAKLQKK
jgi:hypothetical protein